MDSSDFISTGSIDIHYIWQNILDEIAKDFSVLTFEVWLKNLEIVDIKDNILVVAANTWGDRETLLRKENKTKIINAAHRAYRPITNLEIIVKEKKVEEEPSKEKSEVRLEPASKEDFDTPEQDKFYFNPKYTFDNFIVGGSNQFASAAAKAVAENPSTKINPLFIYGGSGLGKTHLLHAIGNYLLETNPKLNVIYVTTNKFANDLVDAIFDNKKQNNNATARFRETYGKADVLIIDDIQEIIKREAAQEQFFNIFNELHQKGKQIVITSDRPPKELTTLAERLRSRFEWGMLADIGVPDIETKIAILSKKAQIERYNVSREVLEYIAEFPTTNIRTMEGYLSRTVFYSNLLKEDIVTIESAREALKTIAVADEETIDATKVIDTVCKFYGIKKEEMLGKRRTKEIAEARQIAMFLITELMNLPLESVGDIFGKNHATVIYAKSKVLEDMKKSKKLEVQINDLKKMIEGK